MDDLGNFTESNRFHEDLIGLEEDGSHGGLKHRVVAEHEGYSVGLCVAHGVDYGKTITGIGHVEVREQDIEAFCKNKSQGFANGSGGGDDKPLALQAFLKRDANVVFVFRQQDFVFVHYRLDLSRDMATQDVASQNGHREIEVRSPDGTS